MILPLNKSVATKQRNNLAVEELFIISLFSFECAAGSSDVRLLNDRDWRSSKVNLWCLYKQTAVKV